MGAGKAAGRNREYQILAKGLLTRMALPRVLSPYTGDGIDVPIMLGSAARTFDVALVDQDGGTILAECKRTTSPVKLQDLDAFSYRVEQLRHQSGQEVSGVFFTKGNYQRGTLQAGPDSGIQLVICAEDQIPEGFTLTWLRYDPVRERRIHDRYHSITEAVKITDDIHLVRIPRTR